MYCPLRNSISFDAGKAKVAIDKEMLVVFKGRNKTTCKTKKF